MKRDDIVECNVLTFLQVKYREEECRNGGKSNSPCSIYKVTGGAIYYHIISYHIIP